MAYEKSMTTDAMSDLVRIESQLAAKLAQASREVSHMEFCDQEQRAEIYTILQAMKADIDVHQEVLGRWISDVTGKIADV